MRKYREPKVTRTFKVTKFTALYAELNAESGELEKTEKEVTMIGEFTAEQCKDYSKALAVKNLTVTEELYGCTASEFLTIAKPVKAEN